MAASTATACETAQAVTEPTDIIFLMLPDTPDVAKVLFAEHGVGASLQKCGGGKVVVDMSSISPTDSKEFAQKINASSCEYLDAPVSRGE